MKIIPVTNQFNEIVAAKVENYSFNPKDIEIIISLIAKYGILIFKKTNISIDDYFYWQLSLGYHQPANIWCSDSKYPIFFRVTNNYVSEDKRGLFSDYELDWHCNILFTPDSEELLGLYAKKTPKGSKTLFANSIPYWKSLDMETKKFLENLYIKITGKIEETYEKKLAHGQMQTYETEDFTKKRKTRDIRKSVNFEEKHYHRYQEPRYIKNNSLKLVPNHALGIKGLYLPIYNVSSLLDQNQNQLSDHRSIFNFFKTEYIDSGRYMYEHEWEEGDIVLADQLTGLHKRNNIWKEQQDTHLKRELLRSACWYKTKHRKHFQNAI